MSAGRYVVMSHMQNYLPVLLLGIGSLVALAVSWYSGFWVRLFVLTSVIYGIYWIWKREAHVSCGKEISEEICQVRVTGPKTIGIFSRDPEGSYSWLMSYLRTQTSWGDVKVGPVYISSNGFQQFRQDVSKYKLAIVYHTKTRGRINVSDVTDALYDEELKYLSSKLGQENVIVVIDDLEDSSPEEKRRILQNQPSIGRLAREMFLFHTQEKDSHLRGEYSSQDGRSIQIKLGRMVQLLFGGI
ncbi:uncharacterized protein LOC142463631 isoform X2 [Ascaphus truei]|uniref:uncharacterized protein LOC142463631 isoform X2 n=1 Tax=Ascaphus truei TaxID=8439 RepID=UPI003F59B511